MDDAWQPSCSFELLRLRAQVLHDTRCFFAERAVLEVETPLLSSRIGTDPQLDFFTTAYRLPSLQQNLFLQTSPEFAMKRLLAAGSGSIYQICKAFRNGESGRFHNPEFTMLEWYRVGYALPQLMDEIDELLSLLFVGSGLGSTQRISYQAVFQQYTGLDALVFSYPEYCAYAFNNHIPDAISLCGYEHVLWLDFIFSHHVQPYLGANALCMVHDYPACQSSLARLNEHNSKVTERVELFINGIELGNGFYELTDAVEQDRRFNEEISVRQQRQLPVSIKDTRLIAALSAGLPDCSGIAIGMDRLLMLLSGSTAINEVLTFSVDNA